MVRRRCPSLERLEDRTAPALYGQPWAMPAHLTISFAPDGTPIGNQTSDMFATLDAIEPTGAWQRTILEAVQAWTSVANVNIGLVADTGEPFGTPGSLQGDSRFGDIRIGAMQLGLDSAALGFPPDPYETGSWSGDIVLNDAPLAGTTDADLFTIALHELGHALGLPDSADDPNSAMSMSGHIDAADVAAIQAIYGPPVAPPVGQDLNAPSAIPSPSDFAGETPIVAYGSLSGARPEAAYSFTTPPGYQGAFTIRLATAGVSLLSPALVVFDQSWNVINGAISTTIGGDELNVHVVGTSPGSTYYLKVVPVTPEFSGGRFGLAVSFDGALQVSPSLIDPVLRAPYEDLDADQIEHVFEDPGWTPIDGGDPPSTLSTAVTLTTTPGFATDTRFQAVIPSSELTGPRYYRFQARLATGSTPLVFTAGLDAAGPDGEVGSLELLDDSGIAVATTVLMDANGVYTIQASGLTPGANYYLCVTPPDGASAARGPGVLVADFLQTSSIQGPFETNTLTPGSPRSTSTLYVARSQYFQFQLSVPAAPGAEACAVGMTILDAFGVPVFNITAKAGQPSTVASIMLAPGPYSVRFSAIWIDDAHPPALSYMLRGDIMSDPIGPIVHDPTYQPLYLGPLGPVITYLYPNGTLTTIPYLWVGGARASR